MVGRIEIGSAFLQVCVGLLTFAMPGGTELYENSMRECELPRGNNADLFTKCGGVFDAPRGVISTPNFPGPYQTPIYCEWLIRSSYKKKVIIYFTQYYMKDSFCVTEYGNFHNTSFHVDRHDLGRISWQYELESLVAYKPYVLIQFMVESIGNRHLRVMNKLLDVHGFNITYEIVDENAHSAKHSCSVSKCSYLGNCIVSADYSKFHCECFEGFFGSNCQYGPYCDPDNGINRCMNGGRCRYAFGSLINECACPPGFYGAYCETAAAAIDQECRALQCSQFCDVGPTGEARCFCSHGYRMDDNGTCIPIARYRVDVSLELASFVHIVQKETSTLLNTTQQAIVSAIKENGVATVSKFNLTGLRNTSLTTVLDFFFYCKVSEVDNVDSALTAVVALGRVGSLQLRDTAPKYQQNPELQLLDVSNYDMNTAVQGKLLTLVCAAKGSRNITFRWYKGGRHMDPDLTRRNVWETVIPHTVQGSQLSVLNIDNVSPVDKGVFTCKVSDFGEELSGDVNIDVLSLPMIELDPMSISVSIGKLVSIKCLSSDNEYEWFKDGVKIGPNSRTEFAEEVLPLGEYLVVQSVQEDTQYSCRVTNDAGSANVTAYIYAVHKNETALFCHRDYEGQVMWQNTTGGHFAVQPCPTEQGDFSLYSPYNVGYARRNCNCDTSGSTPTCSWDRPNFAKCHSLVLIKIHDDLELLRLGYQTTTPKAVFDDLYGFVLPPSARFLYSGDIDMVASILRQLIQHITHFPQLVHHTERIEATRLMELISVMLVKSAEDTPDEKQLISVGHSIIHMTSTLFAGGMRSLLYSPPLPITTPAVDVKVVESIKPALEAESHSGYTVARDNRDGTRGGMLHLTFRHLIDLLAYSDRDHHKSNQKRHEFVSRLHSVASYDAASPTSSAEIRIDHATPVTFSASNTTTCLSWEFESRGFQEGGWRTDWCTVTEISPTYTQCLCQVPGHFAVVVVPSNYTIEEKSGSTDSLAILVIGGYSVALVVIFLTLCVYLRNCGNIESELYRVHCNFIGCLFCCTAQGLFCVLRLTSFEPLMVAGRTFLGLMYIVAFVCLFLEVLHVFLVIHDIRRVKVAGARCLLLCWGGAVFVTLVTVTLGSTVLQFASPCDRLCWLSQNHWTVYAFFLPVAVIVLGYIVVLCACLVALRNWNEDWQCSVRREYLKTIGQSASILILLLLSTSLGVHTDAASHRALLISHVVSHVCLMLNVLIHRCIFSEQVRLIGIKGCTSSTSGKRNLQTVPSSSSFRAYVQREKTCNVDVTREVDSVSKYYDDVNRVKYTQQRKRELSELLGSSDRPPSGSGSGSDGSTDTRCTNVSATSQMFYFSPKGGEGESLHPVVECRNPEGVVIMDGAIADGVKDTAT